MEQQHFKKRGRGKYIPYLYTILLIAVMAVLTPFIWKKLWASGREASAESSAAVESGTPAGTEETTESSTSTETEAETTESSMPTETEPETTESSTPAETEETMESSTPTGTAPQTSESADPTPTPAPTSTPTPAPTPTPQPTPTVPPQTQPVQASFVQGDADYFSDALFIGDSRTVGLMEYGTLKNAHYFASVGMSVYNVQDTVASVPNVGKMGLEELLSAKHYGKIYVMLGINELGYGFDQTVNKYAGLIAQLREKQPDALIFIEANLHVTKKRSDADSIFNNAAINRFNSAIAQLADGRTVFYIDINELFDDGEGNLRQEYSGDNTHVFAKYYADWCAWLCTKTIQ